MHHQLFNCDLSACRSDLSFLTKPKSSTHWGNTSDTAGCEHRVRVIKEIRVGSAVQSDGALRELYPQAKVVVLVRDPRAILASRKKSWPSWSRVLQPVVVEGGEDEHVESAFDPATQVGYPYSQHAASLCQELQWLQRQGVLDRPGGGEQGTEGKEGKECKECKEGKEGKEDKEGKEGKESKEESKEGNVLVISFEDLLRAPLSIAKRLFAFAGLGELPEITADRIRDYSSGRCVHAGEDFSYCRDIKAGAAAVDDKWQAGLEQWELAEIEGSPACRQLLQQNGLTLGEGDESGGEGGGEECDLACHLTVLQEQEAAHAVAVASPVKVDFTNTLPVSYRLYWVQGVRSVEDLVGVRVLQATLPPSGSVGVTTSNDHTFVAVVATGVEEEDRLAPAKFTWTADHKNGATQEVRIAETKAKTEL